jgi:hypothetical protein
MGIVHGQGTLEIDAVAVIGVYHPVPFYGEARGTEY